MRQRGAIEAGAVFIRGDRKPAYNNNQGIGAGCRSKRGEVLADLFVSEHLRAQFLLADHCVSQKRFILSYCSFRSRQLFAQCTNLGLQLRDVTERPTQSLFMRQLEEGDVVVRFFKAFLKRLRLDYGLIDKLDRCAHVLIFSCMPSIFVLVFFFVDQHPLSSLDRPGREVGELAKLNVVLLIWGGPFTLPAKRLFNNVDGAPLE